MNKERRKQLQKAVDLISEIHVLSAQAAEILTEVRDDEQEYMDNMPESLQSSEKYANAEEAVRRIDDAIDILDGIGEIEDLSDL
jgi:hypothetical protein